MVAGSATRKQPRALLVANEVGTLGASSFLVVKGKSPQKAEAEPPAQESRELDGKIVRGVRQPTQE